MMLCDLCANSRGIIAGKDGLELNIDDLIGAGLNPSQTPGVPVVCPRCGLELSALRREGRLGCSECADVFFEDIVKFKGHKGDIDREIGALALTVLDADVSRLHCELENALLSENYEKAAALRDELSSIGHGSAGRSPVHVDSDFPVDPYPFAFDSGPEDDVVLGSSARVYRNIVGLPFPGSPLGKPRDASSPVGSAMLDRLRSFGSWRERRMAEFGAVGRRSLSERGIVPRGYAADNDAVVMSNATLRTYALFDEGDHLRIRTVLPGLDTDAALATALDIADRLGRDFSFAHKPGIGWICSRLADCGLGCSLSATIHIPALAALGMRDRLFRALLSEGLSVRGFYSSSEESAGSVYELGIESSTLASIHELADFFSTAADKVVAAERRARSEISAHDHGGLIDAEGRAFGITRYFGLSGAEEAASLISVLRLSSLRGTLKGADPRKLAMLLMALGSGSVALASGLHEMPLASEQDAFRARLVKDAFRCAEYGIKEGV